MSGRMAFAATVTLKGSGEYEELIIEDHSAGISPRKGKELIEAVNKALKRNISNSIRDSAIAMP